MPLTIANPDSELGRISQIIEAGIQPRIVSVQVKVIGIPERDQVILIRVSKSWNSPHMVSFVNRTRFYLRNNIVGKVQLDVEQIGAVFAVLVRRKDFYSRRRDGYRPPVPSPQRDLVPEAVG